MCAGSVMRRSTKPVSVTMLKLSQLPVKRKGLTDFTFSRYLVPWLMGYRGTGLFLDADMLVLGDVVELLALSDAECDVQVVKNERRFEWPSMMLFQNARCRFLTPEYVDAKDTAPHGFEWASKVGSLPSEWNHCVGYDAPRGKENPAKLVHYTQGVPCWPETLGCEYTQEWADELEAMNTTCTWGELMGSSVHAMPVLERLEREGKVRLDRSQMQASAR